jgi:hypothetical protein
MDAVVHEAIRPADFHAARSIRPYRFHDSHRVQRRRRQHGSQLKGAVMTRAIRAIAQHLTHIPTTEGEAAALIFRAAHHRRCPRCRSRRCTLHGRNVRCRACRCSTSITATTELAHTKIPLTRWLHAIHAIHVATRSTSARGFARQHRLRPMTAWSLLHRVRRALPRRPAKSGPVLQVLGRCGGAPAWVRAHAAPIGFTVLDACTCTGPHQPAASMVLGQLRAYLVEVHKGVSAAHLQQYVDEFADRYGRVGRSASREA